MMKILLKAPANVLIEDTDSGINLYGLKKDGHRAPFMGSQHPSFLSP